MHVVLVLMHVALMLMHVVVMPMHVVLMQQACARGAPPASMCTLSSRPAVRSLTGGSWAVCNDCRGDSSAVRTKRNLVAKFGAIRPDINEMCENPVQILYMFRGPVEPDLIGSPLTTSQHFRNPESGSPGDRHMPAGSTLSPSLSIRTERTPFLPCHTSN